MTYTIILPIVVATILSVVSPITAIGPFGGPFPMDGMNVPAAAAGIESARATGHAIAAENRAAEAMVDRATGNPIGAALNENRALGHSLASNIAASRSSLDAGLAGGLAGSSGAAIGANLAANMASRAVGGSMLSPLGAVGPLAPGLAAAPVVGAGIPGYGAGYGYPYGYPGFVGPLGYGAGMNRLFGYGNVGAFGGALANGIAGSAMSGPGLGIGLGAASRIAALD